MNKFPSKISTASRVEIPFPEKEIIWGSQEGGCNYFPRTIDAITERKFSNDPLPLQSFGQAVRKAQERVWIVDEYLFTPDKGKLNNRVEQILNWLQLDIVANDIRLLTKYHAEINSDSLDRFTQRAQQINSHAVRRPVKCSIEVRTHLKQKFDYLHDRFAIIDDELWHFGGTVGGFHASVSAASRGWRASDHGAVDFFEMAWNAGDK